MPRVGDTSTWRDADTGDVVILDLNASLDRFDLRVSPAGGPSVPVGIGPEVLIDVIEHADELLEQLVLRQTGMTGMTIEEGAATVGMRPPHWLVVRLAGILAELVGEANYTETSFSVSPAGTAEAYTLIVQKRSGKTPHQLRQEADEQRKVIADAARDVLVDKAEYLECDPWSGECNCSVARLKAAVRAAGVEVD